MTILQAKTPQGRKQGLKVEAEETMAGEWKAGAVVFHNTKKNQTHQANKLWRQRKRAEEPEKEQALLEAAEAEVGGAVVWHRVERTVMRRDQEPAEMFLAEQEEEQEVAGDVDLLFLLMMIYSEFSNFSRRGLPLSR